MCGTLNWTAAKRHGREWCPGISGHLPEHSVCKSAAKNPCWEGDGRDICKGRETLPCPHHTVSYAAVFEAFPSSPSFMPLNLSEPSGSAKIQVLRCSALRSHQHQIPRMFLKPSKFDKNQHTIFQNKFSSTDFFPHRIGLLAIEGLRGQVTSISGVQTMVRYTNKFSLNPKIWTKKLWPAAWSWRTRQIPKLNISLSARDQLEKPTKCSGRKGIIS